MEDQNGSQEKEGKAPELDRVLGRVPCGLREEGGQPEPDLSPQATPNKQRDEERDETERRGEIGEHNALQPHAAGRTGDSTCSSLTLTGTLDNKQRL